MKSFFPNSSRFVVIPALSNAVIADFEITDVIAHVVVAS